MLRTRGTIYLAIAAVFVLVILAYMNTDNLNVYNIWKLSATSKSLTDIRISKTRKGINRPNIKPDNPAVIKVLREDYLTPPSTSAYNLTIPRSYNPSMGQAQVIDIILKGKRNGFFVECGALDGELRSNSLFFERDRNWNGILIEADPDSYQQMIHKHRKAYMSNACLAPNKFPSVVMFEQQANQGHIQGKQDNVVGGPAIQGIVEVQCFPLYSFLMALNVTTVDYFSLDIEGAEFSVLQTIPWELVNIKTLSVEFIHDHEGKDVIRELMISKGYYVHSEVTHPDWLANDFIFVKNGL